MAILKEEELIKDLELFNLYKKEEEKNLNSLENKINSNNNLYKTNNSIKINNIKMDISNKNKVINGMHNNFYLIIKKTIDKYRTTSSIVAKDFSKVGDDE